MKLTVTLVTLLSLGSALASPGFMREDKPGFEEHCAACCMQPTTDNPTDPTSTTMPPTTCNPCLLNTTPSPASTPASTPASIPASSPASTPASTPASIPASS